MIASVFPTKELSCDFCVVGGGLSGLCAAVAAARRGLSVVLMQDRPMLGGNASSEVRMWVCGAHGENQRETGLIEELLLENYWRNPYKNYSLWDGVLWEMAKNEPTLTLLLNCTCLDGVMQNGRLSSITGWQMTTQTFFTVRATLFADCSGDSVLIPITGAPYRMGREGRQEYGESIAPPQPDRKTMGISLLFQAREYPTPRPFRAPAWARHFTRESLPFRLPDLQDDRENFWYLELGGLQDTIRDTESIRDELLKAAYGLWDYIKNAPENREKNQNFDLDFIGIFPGKRESRRYIGDHVLTQTDVENGGVFPDVVAYGGWSMDDHDPAGLEGRGAPTIYHPAPSPYGIPFRCLYAKTVENLLFAGRNISVTHSAMSSTRVMATCALLGQAIGTAAALAIPRGLTPRALGQQAITDLQQALLWDDCTLPGVRRVVSPLTRQAVLTSDFQDAENVRSGIDRPTETSDNGSYGRPGGFLQYEWPQPVFVTTVRLVFDSDLNRRTLPAWERELDRPMSHNIRLGRPASHVPKTLVRSFTLTLIDENGHTQTLTVSDHHQRLYRLPVGKRLRKVRFTPHTTHGSEKVHVFAFDVR